MGESEISYNVKQGLKNREERLEQVIRTVCDV